MTLIASLSSRYRVWFCDVWGVVHDGTAPMGPTVAGLVRHRQNGGIVILVSNSPRTAAGVERQLAEIGVDPTSHDGVVTSGDVTRHLIASHGRNRFYLVGTPRDQSLFAGLDIKMVRPEEAEAILCTGLFDELHDKPDDYDRSLLPLVQRGLVMICANPDKIVKKGDRIVPCAGAVAERYAGLGGRVQMAGKPFAPIYDRAFAVATRIAGRTIARDEVLAIGDGPETDIRGAADYGLDALLVADGVTDARHGLDAVAGEVKRLVPGVRLVAAVHDLSWGGSTT